MIVLLGIRREPVPFCVVYENTTPGLMELVLMHYATQIAE